jgi:membrane-bound lytic murein transglycosylase D
MNKALFGLIVAMALCPWPMTAGDEDDFLADMVKSGAEWAQENLPPGVLDPFELPTEAEWRDFWIDLQKALDSGSLEDLAYLTPYVETGLELLRMAPQTGEYADWLRQRADYFEVANAAIRSCPAIPPGKPVPAPLPAPAFKPPVVESNRYVRIVPPPHKVPTASAQIEDRRARLIRSPATWKRMLARRPLPTQAGALVPSLKRIFKEEGVPPELVWVAEVESGMNPEAKNPGGAAGLFQFMPATARRFGLRTWPFDERKHPQKSARAAARYLRTLHNQFGSWSLALAAYNAGEGRVAGLLKPRPGATFEELAPFLPVETQMYVPKVRALVARREGVELAQRPGSATEVDRSRVAADIARAGPEHGERGDEG